MPVLVVVLDALGVPAAVDEITETVVFVIVLVAVTAVQVVLLEQPGVNGSDGLTMGGA